jgi:hypothetical protein
VVLEFFGPEALAQVSGTQGGFKGSFFLGCFRWGEKCCQKRVMDNRRRRLRCIAAMTAALGGAAAAIAAAGQLRRPVYYRRRYRPVYQYRRCRFSLRRWDDAKIRTLCRFTRAEIHQLLPLLQLEEVRWTTGNHPSKEIALCLLLCRLAYPRRLVVIADHCGRSSSWCSAVFNDLATYLFTKFRGILEWHPLLNYERMARFAEAISDIVESRDSSEPLGYTAGEGSAIVWGFVDGTFRGFCRPTGYEQQRSAYSGHKKDTGQKWQAVVTPDGIVSSLVGPFLGPVND